MKDIIPAMFQDFCTDHVLVMRKLGITGSYNQDSDEFYEISDMKTGAPDYICDVKRNGDCIVVDSLVDIKPNALDEIPVLVALADDRCFSLICTAILERM